MVGRITSITSITIARTLHRYRAMRESRQQK
ncbi:unnamed protein product, partial [Rotaria magnacalcarata]